MKRLNIYGAFMALTGPGTKEDIIIQVAKQQNIRFNDLPQLQKEVDRALEESLRLGFVDRQGAWYRLNTEMPTQSEPANVANTKSAIVKASKPDAVEHGQLAGENKAQGQGDGARSRIQIRTKSRTSSCSACCRVDHNSSHDRHKNLLDKHLLRTDKSFCSICGLNGGDKRNEGQVAVKASWQNISSA